MPRIRRPARAYAEERVTLYPREGVVEYRPLPDGAFTDEQRKRMVGALYGYDEETNRETGDNMEANVHTAINQVMQSVGYVQKQRTGGLNYSFAGEAALIEALRPPMVEAGLYMAVVDLRDIHRGEYTTGKGSVMQTVDLTAVIRFTHAPSQTSIDVVALGSGADTGDKASNKALTGAYKYALRQTFCIQTGDDPDNAQPEARGRKPAHAASNGNGHTIDHSESKLWQRWYKTVAEAEALGLPIPKLDDAADDSDIIAAGKDLAAKIAAAKKQLQPA